MPGCGLVGGFVDGIDADENAAVVGWIHDEGALRGVGEVEADIVGGDAGAGGAPGCATIGGAPDEVECGRRRLGGADRGSGVLVGGGAAIVGVVFVKDVGVGGVDDDAS